MTGTPRFSLGLGDGRQAALQGQGLEGVGAGGAVGAAGVSGARLTGIVPGYNAASAYYWNEKPVLCFRHKHVALV